ncbi:MAG TPA: DUF2892 domain-containing protein [Ohtaekwangia sp.]|uniref:YgaP family membrane protein n=1 Tax=Ohtaekwangia sp. TaxID=2066019 RepID=UPI002F935F4F
MKATIMKQTTIASEEVSSAPTLVVSVSTITNVNPAERAISVISGLALTISGVRHFGKGKGISSILGGAYLLARGITGYCAVNALLQKGKHGGMGISEATGTFKVVAE